MTFYANASEYLVLPRINMERVRDVNVCNNPIGTFCLTRLICSNIVLFQVRSEIHVDTTALGKFLEVEYTPKMHVLDLLARGLTDLVVTPFSNTSWKS